MVSEDDRLYRSGQRRKRVQQEGGSGSSTTLSLLAASSLPVRHDGSGCIAHTKVQVPTQAPSREIPVGTSSNTVPRLLTPAVIVGEEESRSVGV